MLQELEFERLKAVAGMEDKAARGQADKYFMKQSAAPFKVKDDWESTMVSIDFVAVVNCRLRRSNLTKISTPLTNLTNKASTMADRPSAAS